MAAHLSEDAKDFIKATLQKTPRCVHTCPSPAKLQSPCGRAT